jgi:hypothetical protein
MTHDELLFIVNSEQYMNSRTPETPYFALRAVIELHKPIEITLPSGIKAEDCLSCVGNNYPCETIQGIEKELA